MSISQRIFVRASFLLCLISASNSLAILPGGCMTEMGITETAFLAGQIGKAVYKKYTYTDEELKKEAEEDEEKRAEEKKEANDMTEAWEKLPWHQKIFIKQIKKHTGIRILVK